MLEFNKYLFNIGKLSRETKKSDTKTEIADNGAIRGTKFACFIPTYSIKLFSYLQEIKSKLYTIFIQPRIMSIMKTANNMQRLYPDSACGFVPHPE